MQVCGKQCKDMRQCGKGILHSGECDLRIDFTAMAHYSLLAQVRMIREQREGSTGPTQKKKKSKCNIL